MQLSQQVHRSSSPARPSALVLVVLVSLIAPVTGLAQSSLATDAAALSWQMPRTAWGAPDLQGTWDYRTLTPLERPTEFEGKEFVSVTEASEYELRANAKRDARQTVHAVWWLDYGNELTTDRRTSLIVSPSTGRIPPMTDQAITRAEARREMRRQHGDESYENRGLTERCLSFGFPPLPGPYNNNYLILQTPEHVVLFSEMIHDTRIVPIDGPGHVPGNIGLWSGDQRGHWEGDTLVVVTTNVTSRAQYRGSTKHLELVERFTRVGPETIKYEATFNDPMTWTEPWTLTMPLVKTDSTTYEYVCHEGNYGLENILHNARYEDNPDYKNELSK